MIHKANAVFYDGESSVAQKTVLFLDTEKGVLFFDSLKNEEHNWKITDITCTQSGQILNLQHGNNPVQNIKVEDSDFVFQVTLFRKKNGHVSGYQKLIDLGFNLVESKSLKSTNYFYPITTNILEKKNESEME